MRELTTFVSVVVLAIAAPAYSQAQSVDLDAGLWQYAITLEVVPRGVVQRHTEQFCLSESDSNMTANDLIARMSQGQCATSNEVLLAGRGSADVTCAYPEDNARGQGRFEATYTTTIYDIDAVMNFVGPGGTTRAILSGEGRRIGDC